MPDPAATPEIALEHLRVIRNLMERAHIYRAVSAPAALVGGLLALAAAGFGYYQNAVVMGQSFFWREFLLIWLLILLISASLNLFLLSRKAKQDGKPFVTDSMRLALRAVYPPLLVGGILGIGLLLDDRIELTALVWILSYGLALLATASFAPRSMIRLGHAFLWTGLAMTLLWYISKGLPQFQRQEAVASLFLGLTFGLYHLLYAAAVFLRTPRALSV